MTTTDIAINKIVSEDLLAFDLKLSGTVPAVQNKRTEPRYFKTFQLKCETYNTESDTFEVSNCIARNFSAKGLFFESKNPFQPRDPVCLSSKDLLLRKCYSELAIGVHAEIVWCKLLSTGFGPRYGVGIKYFEPIESHFEGL